MKLYSVNKEVRQWDHWSYLMDGGYLEISLRYHTVQFHVPIKPMGWNYYPLATSEETLLEGWMIC